MLNAGSLLSILKPLVLMGFSPCFPSDRVPSCTPCTSRVSSASYGFLQLVSGSSDRPVFCDRILKNYKILYDDEALATTIAPERWGQYTRQQARWMRSYLRELVKTGRYMWRKHPLPALSWYAMMWMPIFEPVVMVQALVIGPIMVGHITGSYILGVLAITMVWTLHFWASTGRRWWWAGMAFTLTYIAFYSWQIYWALLTLRGKKWGTRG